MSSSTVYRYPARAFVPGCAFGGAGLLFVVILYLRAASSSAAEHLMPSFVLLILLASAVVFITILAMPLVQLRPLSISDDKLEIFPLFNGVKALRWDEVALIEKVRTYDNYHGRYWNIYFVRGPETSIRFYETLKDVQELLNAVNRYAILHHIKMQLVDRGADARRRAVTNAKNNAERRRIRLDGVRTDLSSLV